MFVLENKTVVVTGAGGGLGTELVRQFLDEGCSVAALVRSTRSLEELKQKMPSEKLMAFEVDVSNSDNVSECFNALAEKFGGVDILFNNAAVYPKVNFLEESPEQWKKAIEINLGGVSNCCKAVLPQMIEKGFGRIYNLGSFAGISPIANSSAYSCSKAGLGALTKSIARDVETRHPDIDIEIHEWIPGHLNTRMSDYTGLDPALSASWGVRIARGEIQASSKCSIFENDHEWLPPKRLKQRIKDRVLFWRNR